MATVPAPTLTLKTPLTELFKVKYPFMNAGMNVAGAELAAAITNAGGIGSIGGVQYTPNMLRREIASLKSLLKDPKNAVFGVDLLLPQIGGNARKTNKDYTGGHLPELIDIIIESGAKLFISAVGVPEKWVVDKLHANGILIQNMIGSTRHVKKAVEAGVDIICAQGTEGGGHTGDVSTMVLIPQVVDMVKKNNYRSAFTGKPIVVVAAGGIYNGATMAAALSLGASGVWCGSVLVASSESKAGKLHVDTILKAGSDDTIRTEIYTGRPMRVFRSPYVMDWENNRKKEMREMLAKGIVPIMSETDKQEELFKPEYIPLLMGQAVGAITKVEHAQDIMYSMVKDCVRILQENNALIAKL